MHVQGKSLHPTENKDELLQHLGFHLMLSWNVYNLFNPWKFQLSILDRSLEKSRFLHSVTNGRSDKMNYRVGSLLKNIYEFINKKFSQI